jgi:hypothetical protein
VLADYKQNRKGGLKARVRQLSWSSITGLKFIAPELLELLNSSQAARVAVLASDHKLFEITARSGNVVLVQSRNFNRAKV